MMFAYKNLLSSKPSTSLVMFNKDVLKPFNHIEGARTVKPRFLGRSGPLILNGVLHSVEMFLELEGSFTPQFYDLPLQVTVRLSRDGYHLICLLSLFKVVLDFIMMPCGRNEMSSSASFETLVFLQSYGPLSVGIASAGVIPGRVHDALRLVRLLDLR